LLQWLIGRTAPCMRCSCTVQNSACSTVSEWGIMTCGADAIRQADKCHT
jgi:hypothetical protein